LLLLKTSVVALNGLFCADVALRNYSVTGSGLPARRMSSWLLRIELRNSSHKQCYGAYFHYGFIARWSASYRWLSLATQRNVQPRAAV